jgi:large subunit ribosomal protein L32
MVIRMRHTRAHTANRRSHHALKAHSLAKCECGVMRVSHRACPNCGRYNGKVVTDVAAKAEARAARKEKNAAK